MTAWSRVIGMLEVLSFARGKQFEEGRELARRQQELADRQKLLAQQKQELAAAKEDLNKARVAFATAVKERFAKGGRHLAALP